MNFSFKVVRPYIIIFFLSILFVLVLSRTISPLYTIEGTDGSVFKLMGLAIIDGKIPYQDILDHKGPLLYAIEALGQWIIPGRWGLFLLQIVSLFVSLIFLYKIANRYVSPLKGVIVIVLTLLTYSYYSYSSEEANLCEDWNIPFISAAYYLISTILSENKSKRFAIWSILIGFCLACSFLIRPNDAVSFIGGPIIGMSVLLLFKRQFMRTLQILLLIGSGFIIGIAPFVIYFMVNNALEDALYGIIGFNSKYAIGIQELFASCFQIPKIGYIPFFIALCVLAYQQKCHELLCVIIPTILFADVLMGTKVYLHYWITWVPVLFFTFWLLTCMQKDKITITFAALIFLSLPVFSNRNWLKAPIYMCKDIINANKYDDGLSETAKLFETLSPTQKDSIWAYNCTWHPADGSPHTFNVLLKNNIIPCNRVPLIFMADIDADLLQDMDITQYAPQYILVSMENTFPHTYSTRDSLYIEERYKVLHLCDTPPMILYVRNDNFTMK